MALSLANDRSRGRNAGYPAPPAQTRTCGFPASGSSVLLAFARALASGKYRMLISPWSDPGPGDELPARQVPVQSNPLLDPPASALQFRRGRAPGDSGDAVPVREPVKLKAQKGEPPRHAGVKAAEAQQAEHLIDFTCKIGLKSVNYNSISLELSNAEYLRRTISRFPSRTSGPST